MINSNIVQDIRNLISNGETKIAIEKLLTMYEARNNKIYGEIVILKSRTIENEKKFNLGLLPDSDANYERNKINYALINLVDKIELVDVKNENNLVSNIRHKKRTVKFLAFFSFFILSSIVLIMMYKRNIVVKDNNSELAPTNQINIPEPFAQTEDNALENINNKGDSVRNDIAVTSKDAKSKSKKISESVIPPTKEPDFSKISDPNVALSLMNLATMYEAQGKYKDSEITWFKVIKIYENAFGKTHPNYARSLQSLALLYIRMERAKEAEKYQIEALTIIKNIFGPQHPETATAFNTLASIYLKLADYKKAAPLIESALEIRKRSLGEDSPILIPIYENLLTIYQQSGDKAKVEEIENRIKKLKNK